MFKWDGNSNRYLDPWVVFPPKIAKCTLTFQIASVITKWRANERYSYGYFRAEVLGGFINGILLVSVPAKIIIRPSLISA